MDWMVVTVGRNRLFWNAKLAKCCTLTSDLNQMAISQEEILNYA